ncbi:MAG TPA: hypothetical protein PLQ04_01415 [Lachnospiraceae bacterium]|nr:hypothetical protein [Lachnospiraceae bacterium]
MISKRKKKIFFDMDGVLVKYVPEHYKGEDPIYFHKGIHFFRKLQEDMTACSLFTALRNSGYTCYVLSRVSEPDGCVEEHTADKRIWLENHFPDLTDDYIILSTKSKHEALKDRGLAIDKCSILIDDFNRNLNEWQTAGGVSVKYINGVNSADSFEGIHLSARQPVLELKKQIERI